MKIQRTDVNELRKLRIIACEIREKIVVYADDHDGTGVLAMKYDISIV